jgi:hypothetical protein
MVTMTVNLKFAVCGRHVPGLTRYIANTLRKLLIRTVPVKGTGCDLGNRDQSVYGMIEPAILAKYTSPLSS